MKDEVLIRFSQCLHTHWDRIRVFTGSRMRMSLTISSGRNGISPATTIRLIELNCGEQRSDLQRKAHQSMVCWRRVLQGMWIRFISIE
ncbi:hypothetical protein K1719_016712 [Acacia pycnantha]|nr:hypothetical protein K1719_016712 [Acacia pycnantha]